MSTTPDPAPEEEEEDLSIRPREIILFSIFGLVPIVILYVFASQATGDARGEAFEQERRLLIAACMEQLDDREQCRLIIDEPIVECYRARAAEDGTVADRQGLRRCVTGRDDDKFRPPEGDQAASDSVQ